MICCVQAVAVDDQVAIVTNSQRFTGQPDEAFDVKQILIDPVDAFGFKDYYLPTIRLAEVVS